MLTVWTILEVDFTAKSLADSHTRYELFGIFDSETTVLSPTEFSKTTVALEGPVLEDISLLKESNTIGFMAVQSFSIS